MKEAQFSSVTSSKGQYVLLSEKSASEIDSLATKPKEKKSSLVFIFAGLSVLVAVCFYAGFSSSRRGHKSSNASSYPGFNSSSMSISKAASIYPLTSDNSCGTGKGTSCPSGLSCCSQYGWCGTSSGHCGAGCQTGYSFNQECIVPSTSVTPQPPSSGSIAVSTDGQCASNGRSCPSATACCSQYGWCGTTSGHCGAGCQSGFSFNRQCTVSSTPQPPTVNPVSVSTDGQCASNGRSCPSATACCSQYGWCGTTSGHCGAGCQSGFSFNRQCTVSSTPQPPVVNPVDVSTDGQCASNGKSCPSSTACCSQYGWCGTTSGHCGAGCQSGFSFNKQCSVSSTPPTSSPNLAYPFTSDASTLSISTDGVCGAAANGGRGAKCPSGQCCGQGSRCGTSIEFCGLVYYNCQIGYGTCSRPSDSSNPLPALGSYPSVSLVASQSVRTTCDAPGQFVFGFDDGVSRFDPTILSTLSSKGVTAVFFINGYNWVDITLQPYSGILRQIHNAGHQIASHTFDHLDLTTLSLDGLWAVMRRNDIAIQSVLGFAPRYVRVPYGNTNANVLRALSSWGYIPVWNAIQNRDTDHSGSQYSESLQLQWSLGNFSATLRSASSSTNSFISLQHDQLTVTSNQFAPQAIDMVKGYGYRFVSLGQCLSNPSPSNWYRTV